MAAIFDIFRITDRFHIPGRGAVYTISPSEGAVLSQKDILFDLHGNRFQVREIKDRKLEGRKMEAEEIETRKIEAKEIKAKETETREIETRATQLPPRQSINTPIQERPYEILFENLTNVEIKGNILLKDLPNICFLFCSHPLYPRKVDEDYEDEYRAAAVNHACGLFSYEDLETGKLSLYGAPLSGLTIYRGWMMKPEIYRKFYTLLEKKGIFLINTPEEYERYHLLPGWYDDFKNETPKTVWNPAVWSSTSSISSKDSRNDALEEVFRTTKNLEGPCIVKDYVKSRKHEWYDACFIEDIQNENAASKIIRNFIDRQGSDLVGGVVLRKFENLKRIGFHKQSGMPLSEEYRVFLYAGKILTLDDYWTDQSERLVKCPISDEEYKWIESIAARVKSSFVTVDLGRKEDGSLIIMEFGDGQVSGLQQLSAEVFYRALYEENRKRKKRERE